MLSKSDVRRWSRRQITGQSKLLPLPVRLIMIALALAAILYLFIPRAAAQDATTLPAYTCTAEDYATMTGLIDEQLATLTQPDAQPGLVMVLVRAAIDTYQVKCTGGAFNQASHPNKIIGPIVFDGTLYEVTFALPEKELTFGSVEWKTIQGDCEMIPLISLASTNGGSETDVLEFKDCVALFEVNTNSTEWSLIFKKLN